MISFKLSREEFKEFLEALRIEAKENGIKLKEGSYPEFFVENEEIEECLRKGIDPRNLGADKLVAFTDNISIIYDDPFIKGENEEIEILIEINLS